MKCLFAVFFFLIADHSFSQKSVPVVKATSKNVAINDGGTLDKNAWAIDPKARPDVFTAERSRKTKWVSFYTDIDSIKVKLEPGGIFDFVVLLNGKDSCFTRIASAIPAETLKRVTVPSNDTIPFTLTAYNAIAVKTIINDSDTVMLHFDTGSWDFRLTRDAIAKKKLGKVTKIQMGKNVWEHPTVVATGLTAQDMDGRFGWTLFEGKALEINYDQNLLIIHTGRFKIPGGYKKSSLHFSHSFITAEANFVVNGKKATGEFLFDTGSGQDIILDSTWAANNGFPGGMPIIKRVVLHNPRGVKFETRIVNAELFSINGWQLTNVLASILPASNPAGFPINNLGNGLLKRFNAIFDFRNDLVYLKPNRLF